MAELGHAGGKKSGEVRRICRGIEEIATRILETEFSPPPKMRATLNSLNLCLDDRISVTAALVSVFAAKGMTGDQKAAQFVLGLAGKTPEARERLAKAKTMEKMLEGVMPAENTAGSLPDPDEIDREARRLGIYD